MSTANTSNDEWSAFADGVTDSQQKPARPQPVPQQAAPQITTAGATIPCNRCGAQNEASQRFCGKCGASLQMPAQSVATPPRPQPAPQTSPAHAANVCPKCQQMDRVAKVSAIVRAGTSSGSYSGTVTTFGNNNDDSIGWTSLSGSSTTRLAQQLQAPVSPGGCSYTLSYIFAALFVAQALFLLFSGFSSSSSTSSVLFGVVVIGGLFCLMALGLFALGRKLKRKRDEVDVPQWQAAQAKWHRSYYCERCDVVFQAGANPDPAPIDHFQAYLYRN